MQPNSGKGKLFGEYMQELGLCTSAQLDWALGYAADCAKWSRYIPIGQALIELGYTTQEKIDDVLRMQARDRSSGK